MNMSAALQNAFSKASDASMAFPARYQEALGNGGEQVVGGGRGGGWRGEHGEAAERQPPPPPPSSRPLKALRGRKCKEEHEHEHEQVSQKEDRRADPVGHPGAGEEDPGRQLAGREAANEVWDAAGAQGAGSIAEAAYVAREEGGGKRVLAPHALYKEAVQGAQEERERPTTAQVTDA